MLHKKITALIVALMMVLACAACGEDKSDDSSMTESLLESYMDSLCDYNIGGMNKCCMGKLDGFDDSPEAVKACQSLADRIEWECETISIDGNSAIAQIKITLPADFQAICSAALGDAIDTLDRKKEGSPADTLAAAIKKRAVKAKTVEISADVSMTKVNNKWYIIKSLGVNRIISDIRTATVAAFAVIGQ